LFTKRFNPYLNDVFGTNIEIDKIELGEPVILNGDDISFPDIVVTIPKTTRKIIYKPEIGLYTPHRPVSMGWDGWSNQNLMTCTPPTTITCKPEVSGYDDFEEKISKDYSYLYDNS
jgi:hypothetical protein